MVFGICMGSNCGMGVLTESEEKKDKMSLETARIEALYFLIGWESLAVDNGK